jgi:glycosyltransferase involved in cell wall biosynthesis
MLVDALHASAMEESARWLHDVAARRAAAGHDILVLEAAGRGEGPRAPDEDPPGVRVLRPALESFEVALGEALEEEPDVVHVATPGPLGARVVEILRELPVLLDVHDFWPICPRSDLLRSPRLHPCGEHFPHAACTTCAAMPRLRLMEERLALAATARTIVTHSTFARARLDAGLRRRIEVVPYGVDTARFHAEGDAVRPPADDVPREMLAVWAALEAMTATPSTPRVLLLGEPAPARGSHLVLDLFVALRARVPDAELIVVLGDGALQSWGTAFSAEARSMGLGDRVRMLPAMPTRWLPSLYRACHVAISPAVAYVPGGLALLEAMASMVPPVAAPMGAVQDLIVDGEEGVLVDASSVAPFADALHRLIVNPGARAAMGEAARVRVLRDYTIERSIARLESHYDGLKDRPRQAA